MRSLALALALVVSFAGCIHASTPTAADQARAVASFERLLPLVDELGLIAYEDSDVCRELIYARGRFLEADREGGRCQDRDSLPFDDVARADLARVTRAIEDADAPVSQLYFVCVDGQIASGSVYAYGGAFDRFTYYYSANGVPPGDWDADATAPAQVNATWWFVNEDWN